MPAGEFREPPRSVFKQSRTCCVPTYLHIHNSRYVKALRTNPQIATGCRHRWFSWRNAIPSRWDMAATYFAAFHFPQFSRTGRRGVYVMICRQSSFPASSIDQGLIELGPRQTDPLPDRALARANRFPASFHSARQRQSRPLKS